MIRNRYQVKENNDRIFSSDSNILSINILDNNKKNIDDVIKEIKIHFKFMKLKSASIEKKTSNYVFWYEIETNEIDNLLKNLPKLGDENLNISIAYLRI